MLRSLLTDNPPGPGKVSHTTRVYNAYGFSSLSEKTRKSNRLQMSLQRQNFLLSYLKTPSVGPAGL